MEKKGGLPLDKPEKLHLIISHNVSENTYTVSEHNQIHDQAKSLIEEFNQQPTTGSTLIMLEQRKAHKTEAAQACRTCRETVQRSSGLEPLPKFTRRME
jgi:hypothetical protein